MFSKQSKFNEEEAAMKNDEEGDDDVRENSLGKSIMCNMGSERKSHGHLQFLHKGPWLCDNEKVCEKVKLYDFR